VQAMSHQIDTDLMIARFQQRDFELRAKHNQQVREAKQDQEQSGWLDRLAALRGKRVIRRAAKSKAGIR
jgi:hypothetical protein